MKAEYDLFANARAFYGSFRDVESLLYLDWQTIGCSEKQKEMNCMTKGEFEYVLMGVFITLITLIGVFSFVLNQAQAGDEASNDSTMAVSEQSLNETSEILDVDSPNDEIPSKEPAQVSEQVTTPIEDTEEKWMQSDDPKVVLEMLKELNDKQANNLLGQEGWMSITVTGPELHESKDVSVNDYHGPDGQIVPAEALRPLGSSVVNEWYYVNKNGLVEKGLTYTTDEYNQVYGQSILQDGAWTSVILKMYDFPKEICIYTGVS